MPWSVLVLTDVAVIEILTVDYAFLLLGTPFFHDDLDAVQARAGLEVDIGHELGAVHYVSGDEEDVFEGLDDSIDDITDVNVVPTDLADIPYHLEIVLVDLDVSQWDVRMHLAYEVWDLGADGELHSRPDSVEEEGLLLVGPLGTRILVILVQREREDGVSTLVTTE